MKCLVCEGATNIKNTICDNCLDLFEVNDSNTGLNLPWIDQVYSIYEYSRLLKDLILSYKFSNKRYYSRVFGELLSDFIVENKIYRDIDLVLSVPLHSKTLKKRGFNQVEEIENIIVGNLDLKAEKNNLIKAVYTKEQARLDTKERKSNLKGAFMVLDPSRIIDKNILLLDDIITSGATINTCGQVLKKAGSGKIIALSIASGK